MESSKRNNIILTGLIVITLGVVGTLVPVVRAQFETAGQSLEVSPPSQELKDVVPGSTITIRSKIRNRSVNSLPITVRIEDFVASGEEGQVALTDKGPWAVSTWTSLTPKSFELKPGETREVAATVKVPSTGVAGGRYGSFVFGVERTSDAPGTAAVSQEVASLFLLQIKGVIEEKLSVTSFSAPAFLEFGPVPFNVTFKNDGNVHVKPGGVIAVSDMFGRKVSDVVVTPTNVFPQASRIVKPLWESTLLFGQYTATAIIYPMGDKGQPVTMNTKFIVFPVRIAAVLVFVGLILYMSRKRLGKAMKALFG